MPAVAKTSASAILEAAERLLDAGGAEAVTMHAIARAESVRPPSLYKHFPDRAAVMQALALASFRMLGDLVAQAARSSDPFGAITRAYRDFAKGWPNRYLHMMSQEASFAAEVDAARRRAALPVLEYLTPLVGASRALTVARMLTAFLHGFVTMELAGAFRLGGNPAADFDEGVELLRAVVTR